MHEGHRKRMLESYLERGFDAFEEHQVLEFILFFCIPRRDTNVIAHRLLETCGSLSAVFDANPKDLMAVEGIGPSSAAFLTMIPRLLQRYARSKRGKNPALLTPNQAAEYAATLFTSGSHEEFYLICLDAQARVKASIKICSGTINELPVYTRVVVETALRSRAFAVILAHNHPGGSLEASIEDIEATEKIIAALGSINISVRDHIIVTDEGCLSLCKRKVIETGYYKEHFANAAEGEDAAPEGAQTPY